jgi:hypothetical protein
MKSSVYIETTVVSYLTSRISPFSVIAGRQAVTLDWWQNHAKQYDLYASEVVLDEAGAGDAEPATRRMELLKDVPILSLTREGLRLGEVLIADGAIPREFFDDALHVAIASVHRMDYLVTWNFQHLAGAGKRRKIERIVTGNGFACPAICTPEELME